MVEVPEWGCTVLIREMSVSDRTRIFKAAYKGDEIDFEALYTTMIMLTAHDPETKARLFDEDDIPALAQKSGVVVERLGKIAAEVSGLDKEAVEEAKKP